MTLIGRFCARNACISATAQWLELSTLDYENADSNVVLSC